MTLLELSIAIVAIAAMLGVFVQVSDGLVNDSADRQTTETMRTLAQALGTYKNEHGVWPSHKDPDTPMARCIAALRSSPKTAHLVADLPGLTITPAGWLTVQDGWSRAMVYVVPSDAADDARVARWLTRLPTMQSDKPFIVSAGPDGQFGDRDSDDPAQTHALLDNHYSFESESTR